MKKKRSDVVNMSLGYVNSKSGPIEYYLILATTDPFCKQL